MRTSTAAAVAAAAVYGAVVTAAAWRCASASSLRASPEGLLLSAPAPAAARTLEHMPARRQTSPGFEKDVT